MSNLSLPIFTVPVARRAGPLEEILIILLPGVRLATCTLPAYTVIVAAPSNIPGKGLLPKDTLASLITIFLFKICLAISPLTGPAEQHFILSSESYGSASKITMASTTLFHSSFPLMVKPLLHVFHLVATLEVLASLSFLWVLRARPIDEFIFEFLVNRQFAVAYFLPSVCLTKPVVTSFVLLFDISLVLISPHRVGHH